MKPKALDTFCKAGGVAEGLRRAGFDVIGVDIEPQHRYPFPFIQGDVMNMNFQGFDLVWASPPCQRYSCLTKPQHKDRHPDLIDPVREKLIAAGCAWVIENVPRAPMNATVKLDGTMFPGLFVIRERLFECSFPVQQPESTAYRGMVKAGKAISVHGGGCRHRKDRHTTAAFREAMGIDWMNRGELADAIPPAYAEYIGRAALSHNCSQGVKQASSLG
ncbi:MAG: DNA cytosine methyltransferase [Rhodospirillales bacterium]|nr:DNA cytosine methyltransferase [Rhodospirillales bacterium]